MSSCQGEFDEEIDFNAGYSCVGKVHAIFHGELNCMPSQCNWGGNSF